MAHRYLTPAREQPTVPEDEHEACANQELHERAHDCGDTHEAQVLLRVLPVERLEGVNLRALLSVGPDHSHAREILLRARRNLREEILYPGEAYVYLLAEILDRQRDERHRHKEHQGQSHVDSQHERQDEEHDQHGLQRVHNHRPGELAHGGEVVGRAGHQVAYPVLVKKLQRLVHQMRVEIPAQVVLDVARHANQYAAL